MTESTAQAETIFLNALEISSPDVREAYIAAECRGNHQMRCEVQDLLDHAGRLGDFLESDSPPPIDLPVEPQFTAELGAQIGPYTLREQIGEGGMGVVYVAEQTEPVRRKVALKIIRPGMATKDVVARFETERQALAMMDHPNIAHVFDGGSTDDGHPFFVMELVQGLPITDFCDQQQLSAQQRLELFLQVCLAVEHAHQKGIIHRDLKPSNVLVPEIDGKAMPKVIDFGVAKALGEKLSEATVYTQFSQMIGTPAYMSPEQAGLGVVDVDTRSDVYSLGVLLYELLTGNTPFDRETLNRAGYDEMRRMIREEQPERPSTRVTTLGAEARSTVARNRCSDPRRLSESLRGELDWIVMRSLDKDRDRRYESARALVEDITRYLNNEVVLARPPSAVYRLRKFTMRNRVPVITAAVVLLALFTGFAVATVGWLTAQRHLTRVTEEQANSAALTEFNRQLVSSSWGTEPTLHESVRQIANDLDDGQVRYPPKVEVEVRRTLGKAFGAHSQFAIEQSERALQLARREHVDSSIVLDILCDLAYSIHDSRWPFDPALSEKYAIQAHELAQTLDNDLRTSDALNWLAASARRDPRRYKEAETYFRRSLTIREGLARGKDTSPVLFAKWDLALYLRDCHPEQRDEISLLFRQAIAMSERMHGSANHLTADLIRSQGLSYMQQGRLDQAIRCLGESWGIRVQLGQEHERRSQSTAENLAQALHLKGDHVGANRVLDEADQACREHGRFERRAYINYSRGWGHLLRDDHAAAESVLREAVEQADKYDPWITLHTLEQLARCFEAQGKTREAQRRYDEIVELIEPHLDVNHAPDIIRFHYAWALLHGSRNRAADALRRSEEGLALTRAWSHHGREPDLMLAKAVALHHLERKEEAIKLLDVALAGIRYPDYLPRAYDVPKSRHLLEETLADYHVEQGNLSAAKNVYVDGIVARKKRWNDPTHLQIALAELRCGEFLLIHGELDEAAPYLREAEEKLRNNPQAAHATLVRSALRLAELFKAAKQPDEATRWQERVDALSVE